MFTSITLLAVFVFFYLFIPALISRIFTSFRLPIKTLNTDLSQQLIEFYVPNIFFTSLIVYFGKIDFDWGFVSKLFNQTSILACDMAKHFSPSGNFKNIEPPCLESHSYAVNFRLFFISIILAAFWGLILSSILERAISHQSKKRYAGALPGNVFDKVSTAIFKFRFPNLLHPWYLVFFC